VAVHHWGGDREVLLLNNRVLPPRVRLAYEALELLEDVLPPPVGVSLNARYGDDNRAMRSYYRMRSELLDHIREEGGLLNDAEILRCVELLGLTSYAREELSVYAERRPLGTTQLHKAHLFYGGDDGVPHGSNHGHGSVLLNRDGSVYRFNFHSPPKHVRAFA